MTAQSQGSMICPNCGKLIGVGEEKCPFCGAWRPGLYGVAPKLQRLFGGRLDFVSSIVATCVLLYAAALILQPESIFGMSGGLFGFLSPGTRALYQLGMTGGPAWAQGWWWTLFTAIFLHGGLLHIFFNMMALRNIGPAVSDTYGAARAFVIFMVAGAVGFLISNLASGTPTIGASGSIFGLLAALIVYSRKRHASMLHGQLWQWVILMFVMGFLLSSVNNWAHAGGFIGGWVTAQFVGLSDEKRESTAVQILALAFIAVTLVGFVLSFLRVNALMMGR